MSNPTNYELSEAIKNILWKLARMELAPNGNAFEWAKIDRNDVVIRQAARLVSNDFS